jgi:hypothetical protein
MKRSAINIESREVWVIRNSINALPGWCAACGGVVNLLSPEEAALLADVKVRTIDQLIEAEKVHYLETVEGRPLICVCSLLELGIG